ncbi:MAG: MoaD/ThiS family protein [Nitrospirota bacterium]|nr:MoaD/ThiS family protein [Nitrospirota bacterium]
MHVIVDLFADLRKFHPGNSTFEIEIEPGSRVAELVMMTGIPPEYPIMVVINEKMAATEDTLRDGDRVGLFSPMGGGR